MLNKKQIQHNFSQSASRYNQAAELQKLWAKKVANSATSYINNDSYILDLGCGTSMISQHIKQNSANFFECDISFEMLQQKRDKKSFQIQCDFENLPFCDNSFDVLVSSFALQWLSSFQNNFIKISQLLKNKGSFIFCLPTSESLKELVIANKETCCSFYFHPLPTLNEVETAIESTNLQIIEKKVELIKFEFDNALQAIKSIKEIGANYSDQKSIINKTQLRNFDNFCLKNFAGVSKSFALSWEVSFFIVQKNH